MLKISYFIKPDRDIIMSRIRIDGSYFDLSTKIKLERREFDTIAGKFHGRHLTCKTGKQYIMRFESKILDKYDFVEGLSFGEVKDHIKSVYAVKAEKGGTLFSLLEKYVYMVRSGVVVGKNGIPLSKNTLNTYEYAESLVGDAIKSIGDLSIRNCTRKKAEKYAADLKNYCIKRNYSSATIDIRMSHISRVLRVYADDYSIDTWIIILLKYSGNHRSTVAVIISATTDVIF